MFPQNWDATRETENYCRFKINILYFYLLLYIYKIIRKYRLVTVATNVNLQGSRAFLNSCTLLKDGGGLVPARRVAIGNQVTKFFYIVGHNVKNSLVDFFF